MFAAAGRLHCIAAIAAAGAGVSLPRTALDA